MKSVVTGYDKCFFCGDTATEEHHLIFGTSGRAFSEKYGLKVGICPKCHTRSEYVTCRIHDNVKAEQLSKMLGQAIFEREMIKQGYTQDEARQKMIAECGRSYL